jgi:hypothetical protein
MELKKMVVDSLLSLRLSGLGIYRHCGFTINRGRIHQPFTHLALLGKQTH